ncbi:MAG: hypothetical protein ACFBZ8_12215 [Opitutales bacterium]
MTPPTQREMRNPYFLLRTPDGLGSYLTRNNYRLLKAPNEPLSQFLVGARLNEDARPAVLEYDYEGVDLSTAEPLEALPASLLEAFSNAANRFVAQMKGQEGRVSDHVKRIWQGFRLPDPDIEKDAYWIYGPSEDRKLLILWGCEFRQGASLPLTSEQAEHPNGSVLDKLSQRRPSWSANQVAALRLIRERQLPLSGYLGELERDETGQPLQIIVEGNVIKAKDAKPMGSLPKPEIEAFKEQARALTRLAKSNELGDYGTELVKDFQLPDPVAHPNLYFLHKGKLVIGLEGPADEGTSLHPIADPQLGIPAKKTTSGGSAITPPTVADQLEKSPSGSKLPLYAAAALVVLLLLGVGAYFLFLTDGSPPELSEIVAKDNPAEVLVVFNEPLSEASIDLESADNPTFRIRGEEGHFLEILGASFEQEGQAVRLQVEPLEEKEYELYVGSVTDKAGNALSEALQVEFEYRDTIPPAIDFVSAHESNTKTLVIGFTKLLEERSVRASAFELPGFKAENAELDEDGKTVRVTFDQRFENKRQYTMTVDGIADATVDGNEIAENTEQIFTYVDSLPPVLDRATADRSQIVVRAFFNEPLDEASAVNPLSYRVLSLDDAGTVAAELEVSSARLLGDDKTVELYTTSPLKPGINYQLQFADIKDRADPPNLAAEGIAGFIFQGREDRTPPQISALEMKIEGGEQFVAIEFEEPVEEEGALKPENYSVPSHPTNVTSVEPTGNPARFVLRLSDSLPEAASVRVQVVGVKDLIGNELTPERPAIEDFVVPGLGSKATDLQIVGPVQVLDNGSTVRITFNEDLVPEPASLISNFTFSGGNRVASAALDPQAPNTVVVRLANPLTPGAHRVTVSNQRLDLIPEDVQWNRVADFSF